MPPCFCLESELLRSSRGIQRLIQLHPAVMRTPLLFFQVAALGHKLLSGRRPMDKSQLPVLSGHIHSLDMQCRGQFVKLTFAAFEKLQLLYGRHTPLADGGHEVIQVRTVFHVRLAFTYTRRDSALLYSHQMTACSTARRLLSRESVPFRRPLPVAPSRCSCDTKPSRCE